MFRLLGWRTTYEPPIEATYYIPDFALPFDNLLAEVKPALSLGHKSFAEAQTKIRKSGLAGQTDFLLLGAKLFEVMHTPLCGHEGKMIMCECETRTVCRTIIGLMSSPKNAEAYLPARLIRSEGMWYPTTNMSVESDDPIVADKWLGYLWKEAGNLIQWKGPKKGVL